jgi:hypothetical protein
MKYAYIEEETNKILGWYDDSIHLEIPTPNIEVTNKAWQKAIDINANYYDKDTKTFIVKDFRTLSELKLSKISSINKICEGFIVGGFLSSALGNFHIYQSNRDDQINLMGLFTAGADDLLKCGEVTTVLEEDGTKTETISWNWKPHTVVQLKKVFDDGAMFKKQQLMKANTLKDQVLAATTVEELVLIEW